MSDEDNGLQEMPHRIEMVYKDALGNLKFLKEQQWPVTKYALTAYGVLFTAAKVIDEPSYNGLLIAAVWLVFLFSLAILISFMHGIRRFRARVRWIYDNFFKAEEVEGLRLDQPKHIFDRFGFGGGLIIVSAVGALLATLAICRV
jgi:hypothetical protein